MIELKRLLQKHKYFFFPMISIINRLLQNLVECWKRLIANNSTFCHNITYFGSKIFHHLSIFSVLVCRCFPIGRFYPFPTNRCILTHMKQTTFEIILADASIESASGKVYICLPICCRSSICYHERYFQCNRRRSVRGRCIEFHLYVRKG